MNILSRVVRSKNPDALAVDVDAATLCLLAVFVTPSFD
jgi:hypothetical protein